MKVLLDTNVILDFLLEREPFAIDAKRIIAEIESRSIEGFLSPTSVTTIHYLIAKARSKKSADEIIFKLLQLFEISMIDKNILIEAALHNGSDFEDSVIYTSALFSGMDWIITRDAKGFQNAKVGVLSPAELVARLSP